MNDEKADNLAEGYSLGHYQILKQIGAGGMGEVYLAEDTKLDRKVALKILPSDIAANEERMRRFTQEAKAAAALNHPNIAHIYEIGEEGGTHFIAMEYVDGVTLNEKIYDRTTPLGKLLKYLTQTAEALAKAHAAGIVHRDLKPDNIMIARDDYAKILDFGLAKLIEPQRTSDPDAASSEVATAILPQHSLPGMIMGTAGYMSPEQAQGRVREIDHRSDIFSFGCILFEAATGRKAFEGKDTLDSLHKIVHAPTPQIRDINPDAPQDLQRIVRRCLAKEPEKRYQSIKDVAIELDELRQELKQKAELEYSVQPESKSVEETPSEKITGETVGTPGISPFVVSTKTEEKSNSLPAGDRQAKLPTLRSKSAILAVALIAFAAITGILYFVSSKNSGDAEISLNPSDTTLAVLPFKLLNADDKSNYLSIGLADSLITKLSNIRNLTVRPTSSVLRYDAETDFGRAGRELKVENVIDGTVQQAGDSVRVSVRLVRVSDGKSLWGNTYDAKMENIFRVQEDVSTRIAETLKIQLKGDEQARLARQPTDNLEAYQLYQRGNYYLYNFSPENLNRAINYFNQAIALDPNYALAYAGLASAYGIASNFGDDAAALRSEAAAVKALSLDPALAETHAALAALYYWKDRDETKARESFNRALELNPNSSVIHHYYSWFLIATARFDEAREHLRQALELDPLSPSINVDQGLPLFFARQYGKARALYEKALEFDPNNLYGHLRLGEACEGARDFACAVSEFERAAAISNNEPMVRAQLARTLALAGKKEEARQILGQLTAKNAPFGSPYFIALAFTALDERDKAFENLNRASNEKDKWFGWIKVDPRFDSLRRDARFQELLWRGS